MRASSVSLPRCAHSHRVSQSPPPRRLGASSSTRRDALPSSPACGPASPTCGAPRRSGAPQRGRTTIRPAGPRKTPGLLPPPPGQPSRRACLRTRRSCPSSRSSSACGTLWSAPPAAGTPCGARISVRWPRLRERGGMTLPGTDASLCPSPSPPATRLTTCLHLSAPPAPPAQRPVSLLREQRRRRPPGPGAGGVEKEPVGVEQARGAAAPRARRAAEAPGGDCGRGGGGSGQRRRAAAHERRRRGAGFWGAGRPGPGGAEQAGVVVIAGKVLPAVQRRRAGCGSCGAQLDSLRAGPPCRVGGGAAAAAGGRRRAAPSTAGRFEIFAAGRGGGRLQPPRGAAGAGAARTRTTGGGIAAEGGGVGSVVVAVVVSVDTTSDN